MRVQPFSLSTWPQFLSPASVRNLVPVLCESLQGSSGWSSLLYRQHLDFCFLLCAEFFGRYSPSYLSSPKWADIPSSDAASPGLCAFVTIFISLQINVCVQLAMFNFLENFLKAIFFSEIVGLLIGASWYFFSPLITLITSLLSLSNPFIRVKGKF